MASTAHWYVTGLGAQTDEPCRIWSAIGAAEEIATVPLPGPKRYADRDATARLISATPDLIAALRGLMRRVSIHGGTDPGNHALRREIDIAAAALTKAGQP